MDIEKIIKEIQERNKRVEADKAWETSGFRAITILIITYILATIAMYFIGVEYYWLNSFVPTLGYFLSIQTMPFLKKWWIKKNIK